MGSLRGIPGVCLAVALVGGTAAAADQMPWQPTIEAAQQIAARTNRLVLLHFWSESCRPCMRLEGEVFSRPEVARALEPNYVMVKLNVDEAPGTARRYGVSSIPTDIITLPNGRLVSQMNSPPAASQYIAQMNEAAAGHRNLAQRSMAQAPNPNDRYAEYFPQQTAPPATAAPGGYPPNVSPPAATAPARPPGAPAATAYGAQQAAATSAAYRPESPRPPQLPPGSPPLALDGYCAVTLLERQQWAMGDARYGAIHRARTYLFLGPSEVKTFLADPEKYAPVLSGHDPVLALDNRQMVPGRREFGVYSDRRVYLFADENSRRRFEQNPKRYTPAALQAAGPAPVVR